MEQLNEAVLESINKFAQYIHTSRKEKKKIIKMNSSKDHSNSEDKNKNISFYQDLENNSAFNTSNPNISNYSSIYKTCKVILVGESGK